jgi:hypothetical protein
MHFFLQEYQILQQLEFGSSGSVVQPRNGDTGQIVCIKTINFQNNNEFLRNAQKESQV